MTREITSTAVLQLYEAGKFKLDDPIQKYLPEFSEQRVLMDPDSTDVSQAELVRVTSRWRISSLILLVLAAEVQRSTGSSR